MRIDIGSPPEGIDIVTFVLPPFESKENVITAETVEVAVEAAKVWAKEGIEVAMQRLNR